MPFLAQNKPLLARFRRGDPSALEEVYRAYIDRVERVVRYGFHLIEKDVHVRGAPRDEVADLVQETFARAFVERARLAYDGVRDYGPFLATITRNLLVDRARRSGRELSFEGLEIEEPPEIPEDAPYADEATMKVVRDYLASLPADLRGVHEERYVRALSQEEAAKNLGLSRQQLRTLEKKLRAGLERAMAGAGILVDEARQQPAAPDLRMEKKVT